MSSAICSNLDQSKILSSGNELKFYSTIKNNSTSKLLTTQSRLLMTLYKKPFENSVGKGENAGNQHFLLFPQRFLSYQKSTL